MQDKRRRTGEGKESALKFNCPEFYFDGLRRINRKKREVKKKK